MGKTRHYRKSRKSRKQTRKVRKPKMKGCVRCNKRTCGKKSQRGGGCGCGAPMMGGMKMGGSDPAVIGPAWTGAVSTWPGVAGVDGQTNNFALNSYPAPVDLQTQSTSERDGSIFPLENVKYLAKGGRRRNIKKGGGFLPQDLVNMGRSVAYGFGSAYNALNGYPSPVDPLPYKDQFARV